MFYLEKRQSQALVKEAVSLALPRAVFSTRIKPAACWLSWRKTLASSFLLRGNMKWWKLNSSFRFNHKDEQARPWIPEENEAAETTSHAVLALELEKQMSHFASNHQSLSHPRLYSDFLPDAGCPPLCPLSSSSWFSIYIPPVSLL